ncbi:MAG TPA: peptidylprolyl isomerase [Vicinamibacterales bacterium]|jgi:peptidyl-prolyl cis-trans isomerase A (cyclophilin A)
MTRVLTALALAAVIAAPSAAVAQPSLKNPASLTEKAPDTYKVKLDTSAGPVVIQVTRAWAPLGADRFYNLVKNGFYDGARFFRVLSGFMAQVGMNGDPAIQKVWGRANFNDDPVKQSNKRGFVTFAKTGAPNSRSTQFYINYGDNSSLDPQGFAPFGQVLSGMEFVDKLYTYGKANVPDQSMITAEGNAYLQRDYPKLDFIKKATIEK